MARILFQRIYLYHWSDDSIFWKTNLTACGFLDKKIGYFDKPFTILAFEIDFGWLVGHRAIKLLLPFFLNL